MDIEHFRKKLEEEKARLETQLKSVGQTHPGTPDDWEPQRPEFNAQTSDENEMADVFEEFQTDASIEVALETQLNEVKAALKRIDEGTFGKCIEDGKPIDPERLEANPAAARCVEHTV
ncbi:MAG: TraR/DksA C4-type zinc finger protein [Candidatus Niyogibacteria bacterium]|nr:TraR/DksA C4-type zinc finger protein [Candidatus Niyogibacteria bacterium]